MLFLLVYIKSSKCSDAVSAFGKGASRKVVTFPVVERIVVSILTWVGRWVADFVGDVAVSSFFLRFVESLRTPCYDSLPELVYG